MKFIGSVLSVFIPKSLTIHTHIHTHTYTHTCTHTHTHGEMGREEEERGSKGKWQG